MFDTVAVDLAAGRAESRLPRHAARRCSSRASSPSIRKARTTSAEDEDEPHAAGAGRRRPRAAANDRTPTSTSPSRRRASPKRRWSRRSRSTASAGPRPTPPSSRRCVTANTCEMDGRRFIPTDVGAHRRRLPVQAFHPVRRLRLHRQARGRARRGVPRRGGLGAAAGEVLGAVQGPGRGQETSVDATEVARRASSAPTRSPASRSPCAWAATDRSCRSAPRTTRKSRSSRACVRARSMHTITLADALELFKLPRKLGLTADGMPSASASAASGRTSSAAPSTPRSSRTDDPYTIDSGARAD